MKESEISMVRKRGNEMFETLSTLLLKNAESLYLIF
jgi:hypothetical protein